MARVVPAALLLAAAIASCARGPVGTPRPATVEPAPPAPVIQLDAADVAGPPEVVAARPSGAAEVDVHPTITFSKPMVALASIAEEAARPAPATVTPPIDGDWRWLGSASVELVPRAPLPHGTAYTVTVPAGLRALDGTAVEAPTTVTFETPRPRLDAVVPAAGSRWEGPRPTIALTWSFPVADLADHLALEVTERGVTRPVPLVPTGDARVLDELRAERRVQPWELDDTRHVYRFVPATPLPLDADVRLVVTPGVRSPEGPLGTETRREHAFRTYAPLAVLGARPCEDPSWQACTNGPIVLSVRNPVDLDTLKARLTVDPPVAIDWEHADVRDPARWRGLDDPYVTLPGRWQAGTTYTIAVAAGVRDVFGQASAAPFRGTLRTSDLAPSVRVPEPVLLEAAGDGRIPVTAANVRTIDAEVWKVDVATLARLAAKGDRAVDLPKGRGRAVLLMGPPRNVRRAIPLDVKKAMGASKGLFVARFTAPGLTAHPRTTTPWVEVVRGQVTDLAVHAKLGPASGVAWVTSLATGRPVPDARVDLVDAVGVTRWSGRTDADGLAAVPGLSALLDLPADEDEGRWEAPFALVAASKGDDVGVTLSTWSGDLQPWRFGVGRDWDGRVPQALGAVFAERGIYRPGDTVRLKGVARTRKLGRIGTPPKGARVTVRVTGPDGEEVWKGEAVTSSWGTFDASVPLPADGRLGAHEVLAATTVEGEELTWWSSFRVEQYKAPPFRVDVTAPVDEVVAGAPLRADVLARYLFGAAMAEAPVRWSIQRNPIDPALAGAAGFTVGRAWSWWDDEVDDTWEHAGLVASGEGRADALGALRIDGGAADAPSGVAWEVTLEAEAEDVSRVRAAGRASVIVHPAAAYAGVRTAGAGFPKQGVPATVELIAVGLDGQRVAGRPLALTVTHRSWSSIRKVDPGGGFHTETVATDAPAGGCAVTSALTPVTCTFTPGRPGLYRLEATVTDAGGRRQTSRRDVLVFGDGWVGWNRDDSDRVELVADRTSYDVGDVAHVLVQSPWPAAEALVTVEREGVLSTRRVTLQGSSATFDVPLTDAHVPNVFVGVVLVRGRVGDDVGGEPGVDPGRPAFRVGYVELPVEKRSKRLDVAVTPSTREARPGQRVGVDLAVKDAAGRPVQAEVTVWAVDEAVLRLTGYARPDLVEALHPPRGLSTFVAEPLLMLTRFVETVGKGEQGGGGGADVFGGARRDFRTTPLFLPSVVTDASGHAHVELPLPDDLTTFRVMAVAIDAGDRAGGGEAAIEVRKPLLALPSLPRLLRVGDHAEIGVVVHAPALRPRKVVVTARTGALRLDGAAQRTVSLADGRPVEVRFPVTATAAGHTEVAFAVVAGDERDALALPFEVTLPVGLEAVATYGSTSATATEALVPPGAVRDDVGGLEVTLSSTLLGGLGEGMGQLLDYPYGCLEQLASRLGPLVTLRRLQARFGAGDDPDALARAALGDRALRAAGAEAPAAVVAATVRRIEALQRPDGGYAYWDGEACSSALGSAWAYLSLSDAAAAGFAVDAGALRRAEAFLADRVLPGQSIPDCWWGPVAPDVGTRVFALWALTRAGHPRASWFDPLHAAVAHASVETRALLADAMIAGGATADGRALLRELLDDAEETPSALVVRTVRGSPWSSDVRTTALALQALVAVDPTHVYVQKLARALLDARRADGRWRTTQDAAFALRALAEVTARAEAVEPDFTASVRLGDEVVATERFVGRGLDVRAASVPIAALPRGGQLPLAFAADGRGLLVYGALLRYAPADLPTDPLDRGIAVQRWIEPWRGPGQVHVAAAGELVRVRVRLATSRRRTLVAVDVPLPAGLEIVDTTLATTARPPEPEPEDEAGYEGEGETIDDSLGWWWSPFDHVERRDGHLTLFADELPPGVWETTVIARATTPGDFLLPPARAEEMYAPEVFGRSDGGRFRVDAPIDPAPR